MKWAFLGQSAWGAANQIREEPEDQLGRMDVVAEDSPHPREAERRPEPVQLGSDGPLDKEGVDQPEERPLHGARHAGTHVEVREPPVVDVAAKDARLQVDRRRRDPEPLLGDPRPEAQGRRGDHGALPAALLDDPVEAPYVGKEGVLNDASEPPMRVPEPRIPHDRVRLGPRPKGDEFEAV